MKSCLTSTSTRSCSAFAIGPSLGHPHDAILVERGACRRAIVAPRLGEGVHAEQPRDERGVRAAEPLDREMAVGRRRVLDC